MVHEHADAVLIGMSVMHLFFLHREGIPEVEAAHPAAVSLINVYIEIQARRREQAAAL